MVPKDEFRLPDGADSGTAKGTRASSPGRDCTRCCRADGRGSSGVMASQESFEHERQEAEPWRPHGEDGDSARSSDPIDTDGAGHTPDVLERDGTVSTLEGTQSADSQPIPDRAEALRMKLKTKAGKSAIKAARSSKKYKAHKGALAQYQRGVDLSKRAAGAPASRKSVDK